jgi:predicted ATPase
VADGTLSGRYAFQHVLYQNVLYERIAQARRVRLHRLIGERQEQAYGERAREVATELAMHFERGRNSHKAAQYLEHAGKTAVGRSAPREAVNHFTKAIELLTTWPDSPGSWFTEVFDTVDLQEARPCSTSYSSFTFQVSSF